MNIIKKRGKLIGGLREGEGGERKKCGKEEKRERNTRTQEKQITGHINLGFYIM